MEVAVTDDGMMRRRLRWDGSGDLELIESGLIDALTDAVYREDFQDRLSAAGTSASFTIEGTDRGVTLLLDRDPVEVLDRVTAAEAEFVLTPLQVEHLCRGLLQLPVLVQTGEVRCRGSVRRFLAIEPVVRGLLRNGVYGDGDDAPGHTLLAARPFDPAAASPVEVTDGLAVETRDLHKSFGSQRVLAGMNLTIPEGALSVVMGPSGTGKSVLIKHIVGLMRPDAGEVLVRGQHLAKMRRSELTALRRDVGVMYQDGALFSSMNVFDNVAFPIRQHSDLEADEVTEVVTEHLTGVGLADAAHLLPSELSGGMKKRVGLARALVLDPYIVLCDEPDSGLDPVRTALMGELLLDRHAALGGTMIVVTHNSALARLVSDHVSVVWRGQVVESGPAERVWNSDNDFVRQFVSGHTEGPLDMGA
jgi:phospholipid/cholesterol/gamma-HCH transport system ATP-binding protein